MGKTKERDKLNASVFPLINDFDAEVSQYPDDQYNEYVLGDLVVEEEGREYQGNEDCDDISYFYFHKRVYLERCL